MDNFKKIKILTIVSFLLIVFPGKIAFLNLITIFLGILNLIFMIGIQGEPSLETFKSLSISIIIIFSILFFFKKNNILNIICIIIQYFYLFYMYDYKYLKYWYYTVPTSIYLILSIILVYKLFSKK